MSRTPQINLSRSSFVKLPEIEKNGSQVILESFGVQKRSVSKAQIFEANKKKLYYPSV